MSKSPPNVELSELLTSVSRRELVDPAKIYRILGAHWYAKGLYTKNVTTGSEIRAKYLYKVEEGDFVYNRLFGWKGSFAEATEENDGCYVSNEFPCFRIYRERLDSRYLWKYFSLTSTWSKALGLSSGGTPTSRNRLKEDEFLAMEIPLPPLAEQRRIVQKIESLATKIEEAQRLRRRSAEEVDSVLASTVAEMFRGGERKGWKPGCLGDYVIHDNYGTSEKTNDDPEGIPILRMGNIQNGRLDVRDLKYLQLDEKDRERYLIGKGDILVNRTNSAELVGKCAVFDLNEDYGFASYLIRIHLDTTRAEPRLVAWYINSPIGRSYMFRERKQMTGQANVNAKKLKALPLSLPKLPEQQSLVAKLRATEEQVETLKHFQSKTDKELDALIPSILSKAFNGEL